MTCCIASGPFDANQRELMGASLAANDDERLAKLEKTTRIAGRIGVFQCGLGAAAASAWSKAQFAPPLVGLELAI